MAEPPAPKAQRGLKGISRLGARTVRNGAFLLERRYSVGNLTFLTCTLPRVDDCAEFRAGAEWSEIVRIFLQGVTRLLKAAGLPPSYVGCTEIQESRMAKFGGLPLHLHVVFPGRAPYKSWAIGCEQFRAVWRRAVVARCPEFSEVSFASSVDAQAVKRSAEGYLGKYMSKGVGTLAKILAEDPGMAEFIPRSWWCCSMNLKRAIGRRIVGGTTSARRLIRDVRSKDSRVGFSAVVEVTMPDGVSMPVAIIGKLSAEGRKKYCEVRISEDLLDSSKIRVVASVV